MNSILDVFPSAVPSPGVLVGNTDTKHYADLASNVYRFSPALLDKEGIKRFHGIDERISVENYGQVVNFCRRMVDNADAALVSMQNGNES